MIFLVWVTNGKCPIAYYIPNLAFFLLVLFCVILHKKSVNISPIVDTLPNLRYFSLTVAVIFCGSFVIGYLKG